tara:strand:+ start:32 stop:349 length:318 start_codon:yes stop_codon:yes gene_type:complete
MKKVFIKLRALTGKSFYKYFLIFLAFFIWMTFLDTNSLQIHGELNEEIKKLKKKKAALNDEIDMDQRLIEKLSNIDSLEHYGRENYNLKKEDEDIYIIEYRNNDE